jgi:hypothetical protein
MNNVAIDHDLKMIYENYHKSGVSEWRAQTARDKARHVISLCEKIDHGKTVEVGAGDGAVLAELAQRNFSSELYALEVAESAVTVIQGRTCAAIKECRLFDGYTMPYRDKEFDLAIASHVLEHVEHPRLFIKEMQRISKRAFYEVPLEYCVQGRRDVKNSVRYGHVNCYSPFLIEQLFKSSGIRIVQCSIEDFSLPFYRYQSPAFGPLKFIIRNLLLKFSPSIASKLFIYCYCIVCE